MFVSYRAALTLAATALVLSGCPVLPTENLDLPAGREVASVGIDPSGASLSIGGTREFSATAWDTAGKEIAEATFTWTLSDTSVAEFVGDAKGKTVEVKGKAFGTTHLTASYASFEFVVTVTVSSDVGSVTLTGPESVVLGDEITFSAVVRDQNGNEVQRDVSLVAENALVLAPVDGAPTKLRATGVGQVVVQAHVDDVFSNTVVVTAKPHAMEWQPKSLAFAAGSFGTLDLEIEGRNGEAPQAVLTGLEISTEGPFTATLLDPDTVRVSSEVGGTGSVTGNFFGVTATASVTSIAVAAVEITGSSENLIAGESRTFTAVAKDERGGVIDGATITWFTGNAFGAGYNALEGEGTGSTFTPTVRALGRGSVWASAGGVTSAVHLVVVPDSVDLHAERTFLALGEVLTVRATPRTTTGDALSSVITQEGKSDFAWSLSGSSFELHRTPSPLDAIFIATTKGTAGLSLTLFGVQSDELSLTAAEVVDVSISAETSPLAAGEPRDFTATVTTDPAAPAGTTFGVAWLDEAGLLRGGEFGATVSLTGDRVGLSALVASVGTGLEAPRSDPFVVAVVPFDGFIPVTTVDAGNTTAIAAVARTSGQSPLLEGNFAGSWSWSVEDESIATITVAEGVATLHGHKGGTTSVTATWIPPDGSDAWDGADVTATGSVTVSASPAPVDGDGDFLADWIDFDVYELSFPQATDVGTPQEQLQYEIFASKEGTDPFTQGTLVTGGWYPTDVPGAPITELFIHVNSTVAAEYQGASPHWVFGVRAVDGEGQTSPGKLLSLKRHENPAPGTAAVFGAAGRLAYVGPSAFGFLGDAAPEAGAVEWTAGTLAHDGALVGIGSFGGQQHLFRRPAGSTAELSTLSLGAIATETTPGACSAVTPRPVVAFGARATFDGVPDTEVVVYTATEGRLGCDEAVLVMRHVETGQEELLATAVTAAAGWDDTVWYVARVLGGTVFVEVDLATGEHSAIEDFAGIPSDALLSAWNGAVYALVPSASVLAMLDGALGALGNHADFSDARAFTVIDGNVLIERTNGDLFVAELEVDDDTLELGESFTLTSEESLGGERFVLGASR